MTGALIVAVGFSVVGAAVRRLIGGGPRFLLGLGTVGVVLYVALLLHVPAVPVMVAMAAASLLVIPSVAGDLGGWWRETRSAPPHPKRFYAALGMAAIVAPILFLLFASAITPLGDFDGRAFWVLKAKAIAVEERVDGPFFHGLSGLNPKNEYPLLVPLAAGAVMIASGHVDDIEIGWIYVLALGSLALHARRWAGVWPAALIVWIPQFAIAAEGGALSGYNDIVLAAFAACAFFELIERESPLRFGVFISLLVLTKNEGLPLALLLLAAGVMIWRGRIVAALAPFGVALATLLVWRLRVDPTDDDRLISLLPTLPDRLERFVPAVTGLVRHAAAFDRWGLFWMAVAVSAGLLAARRQWRLVVLPASLIAGMSCVYIAAYMVTTWPLHDHVEASADRLLMHFIGPAVFLIGGFAKSRYSHGRYPPTEA